MGTICVRNFLDGFYKQFIPWLLLLLASAYSHDSENTTSNPNITTLYPTNKTIIRNDNQSNPSKNPNPQKWKFEATFTASNFTEIEPKNNSVSKEENDEQETKEDLKDFKPSQHLGSFFDDDTAEIIKTPVVGPVIKKPASGFVGSVHDDYPTIFNKIPKDFYETHKPFPYKFEDTIFTKTKPTWYEEAMDSKPTVEAPVKLPAGGYYKSPDTMKQKPNSDEEFGLDINEEAKDHGIRKRMNPWQDILRLVTAFIPVGLIISALTPSVITIQNLDDNRDAVRPGLYRRSDPDVSDLTPISERCRRRLLCELHSDQYYAPSSTPHKRKRCYKIRCEDTEALWRMLQWLFAYHQSSGDTRGRHLT